jgi:hypothetical protein
MADQPKALRLADFLDDQYDPSHNLEEAAAELRRLSSVERAYDALALAYDEWTEKTQWVQDTKQTHELGMHRADVLKQRIERLKSEKAELLELLRQSEAVFRDIGLHARAAIAKEEGQP